MSKKTQSLREQYERILEKYGTRLEDCRVLAFRFKEYNGVAAFHYLLMSSKVLYYLFDGTEGRAQVVIQRDENAAEIVKRAAMLTGGQDDVVMW